MERSSNLRPVRLHGHQDELHGLLRRMSYYGHYNCAKRSHWQAITAITKIRWRRQNNHYCHPEVQWRTYLPKEFDHDWNNHASLIAKLSRSSAPAYTGNVGTTLAINAWADLWVVLLLLSVW
jgi:hypothetical protein